MYLAPSEIFFSQDSINNVFVSHGYKPIGDTLDALCEGRCSISSIPTISVMKRDNKWYTADNRRLWVFRHMERLGKCDRINVRETSYIPLYKFTTYNGGVSVDVRRSPGGYWHRKPSVVKPKPCIAIEETTITVKDGHIVDTEADQDASEANSEEKEKEKIEVKTDINNNTENIQPDEVEVTIEKKEVENRSDTDTISTKCGNDESEGYGNQAFDLSPESSELSLSDSISIAVKTDLESNTTEEDSIVIDMAVCDTADAATDERSSGIIFHLGKDMRTTKTTAAKKNDTSCIICSCIALAIVVMNLLIYLCAKFFT